MKKQPENFVRKNSDIRTPKIILIDEDNKNLGEVDLLFAKKRAYESSLDLVEVSPNASPPVCKLMDYGKYKYEQSIRDKNNKKNSKTKQTKQVQVRPNTGEHDLQVKIKNIRKFIGEGNTVSIRVLFKGRDNAHKKLGIEVLNSIISELAEEVVVTQNPTINGRIAFCLLDPNKN